MRAHLATIGLAAALAVAAVSTQAQAEMAIAPKTSVSPQRTELVSGRCGDGYHEVIAPNGNGYMCRADGY